MKKLLMLLLVSGMSFAMQPIPVPGAQQELKKGEWRPVKPAPLGASKSLVELEREKAELNKEITELNKKMEASKVGVRSRGERLPGRKGDDRDPMRMLVIKRDSAERKLREVEKFIADKKK